MNIILNGKQFSIDKKMSIKDILVQNNIGEKNIVVEVNKEIISKSQWDQTILKENDQIEIITAVGGG
tara:strand:- start:181 stop:381 length:201 start_codon:yes stop_codon:yes gene_type:complete